MATSHQLVFDLDDQLAGLDDVLDLFGDVTFRQVSIENIGDPRLR